MLAAQAATLDQLEDEAESAVNAREEAERAAAAAEGASAMGPPVGSFAYFRQKCAERYHHEFTRAPG
eukprot:15463369-Alexandrium_andersonii.AAC.1